MRKKLCLPFENWVFIVSQGFHCLPYNLMSPSWCHLWWSKDIWSVLINYFSVVIRLAFPKMQVLGLMSRWTYRIFQMSSYSTVYLAYKVSMSISYLARVWSRLPNKTVNWIIQNWMGSSSTNVTWQKLAVNFGTHNFTLYFHQHESTRQWQLQQFLYICGSVLQ